MEFTTIETKTMLIMPEMAKQMLTHNEGNIPVKELVVDMFAGIINRGEWKLTTDAIGFSKTGRLINGQHRLLACIKANKPIQCLVTTGLAEDVFMAIDTCNKRKSASDVMYLNGVPAFTAVSAIITGRIRLSMNCTVTQGGSASYKITPTMILSYYQKNAELVQDIVKMADTCYKRGCKAVTKTFYGMYALYLIYDRGKDKQLVFDFMEALADRKPSTRSNAMDVLRKRLIDDKCSRARLTHRTIHLLFVNTWNAYQECRFVKCLKPNEVELL